MLCKSCGHENPADNLFCGKCGTRVERRSGQERRHSQRRRSPTQKPEIAFEPGPARAVSPVATSRGRAGVSTVARREIAPVHGASFLGLSDQGSADYLLADDRPRRSYVRFILLLILLAAVGVLAMNWQSIKDIARAALDYALLESNGSPATPEPAAAVDPTNDQQPAASVPTPADNAAALTEVSGSAAAVAEDVNSDTQDTASTANVPPQGDKKDGAAKPAAGNDEMVKNAEKYLYGIAGTEKNCRQALSILKQAAGEGNVPAQAKLGVLYSTGNCVAVNRVRAYNWYVRASQAEDSAWLERSKSVLWAEMTGAERRQVAGR